MVISITNIYQKIDCIFKVKKLLTTNNYTIRINSKCSGNNFPLGSSSDFVFTSGTTLPEIELKGTYTGSGIVFGKPSYNLWSYINNFVFNAQNGGGVDPYGVNGGNGNNYNGWDATREVAGTAMVIAGQPIIPKSSALAKAIFKGSRVVGDASKNTSLASLVSRRLSTSNTAFKILGTKSLGGIAGRFVPWVGWGLLAYDIYDNREAIMWGAQQAGYGMGERQTLMQQYPFDIPVCFVKGTLVHTILGLTPIEKIAVGDSVYSYNLEKNIVEKSKVVKVFERVAKETYLLNTNKEQIEVTAEHPFYVENKGWVKVKDLQTNYILKTENNKTELIKTTVLIKEEKVYNIEVEGNHNYFISKTKILVHNK